MGIIVHEQTSVVFTPINDRLCMAKIKQNENKPDIVIISAYAPHTQIVEKNQEIQEEFYENLDQIISQVSNQNILIICGDMNAKTGSEHKNHPDVVGKFGKGEANKNGMALMFKREEEDSFKILACAVFLLEDCIKTEYKKKHGGDTTRSLSDPVLQEIKCFTRFKLLNTPLKILTAVNIWWVDVQIYNFNKTYNTNCSIVSINRLTY